ncbi:hypothetical protein MERGE_000901 [Pneumocystis wakefieldiae]|uniref:Uncharacterized protein n=1 Tax=Pneumocystis wakefieldiae TaxID=38082 RepID=A0A899FXJ9_9ASCO|nr:hypothetical protein MERGE_000901 [Pneumocystis wakefieldiae]
MTIFQIDLTKLECISKEEKEFILFNILLEISEELENFELEQLNIKQTEILQILFKIIKPQILVPSRIIRNQLGRCFQVLFSRSNSISIFSAFNILLENILLPKIEDHNLHIKWFFTFFFI